MIVLAFTWGIPAYEKEMSNSDSSSDVDYQAVFKICGATAFASLIISVVMLSVMMCCVTFMIKVSLLWTVAVSGAAAVWCFMYGNIWGGAFSVLAFLCGCCYARAVWSRIPFAAENLKTGITAVKSNLGIVIYAYMIGALVVVFSMIWSLVVIGINYENGGTPNTGYLFLLFLSLFWTQQVIQNVIHVSVAGLVGTWWFDPVNASGCCSSGVHTSVCRATTYSFGSICFGSLLVAIIQALRQLVYALRENGENACLVCLLDCLLGCIEGTLRYFNKWAYVYVGLYGYPYLQSGKRVLELFEARGFTVVITDDLVSNTLALNGFVIALLTGAVALAIKAANPSWFVGFEQFGSVDGATFFLGFIMGLIVACTIMSVISSAVDTVIVCWAEAPADLEANHNEEFNAMRDVWYENYPECCPSTHD
eukprot:CAMPEP_0172501970 /NCGR_PEP_ID=MMETSP1066-20121228/155369_1 /TAXON_ID=671091 /ORGANISM="Coscinodiscus wailesii, Strain CCMP2513" /LENGTH=421 /DNA_ID=CAMNT_0013277053 /DNA_START=254 /DNA_END=1519 /DNA_ORIENTATION=+